MRDEIRADNVQVGAARALRLVDFEGRVLAGVLSEPKWETRGGGLFFTREFGGTRNIWRAFPDPRDASRYPRWRALPVTQFAAPLFAFGASPLEGDRALLMVSNAANIGGANIGSGNADRAPRLAAQATLFDLQSPAVRAITDQPEGVLSVAPAPDNQAFAFAAVSRSGTEAGTARRVLRRTSATQGAVSRNSARNSGGELLISVWTQSLRNVAIAPVSPAPLPLRAQSVVPNSWRPAWQGAGSLLIERVPNQRVYRFPVGAQGRVAAGTEGAQIASGTQVSASRDGSMLVLVGKTGDLGSDQAPRLYLLAGDGSGLRALSATEGAQSPALSGNGRFLAYVAPLDRENGSREGNSRDSALWILPLQAETAPEPPLLLSDNSPESDSAPDFPISIAAPAAPSPLQAPPPISIPAKARAATPVAAPVAQLSGVQSAARGAIAIFGRASGVGATATLEIEQGAVPGRWEARRVALPGRANAPLLVWNPPASARGVWNFRLTISGPNGAAQSLFSTVLPLAPRLASSSSSRPSPSKSSGSMPAGGPLPTLPLPDLPAAPLPSPAPLPPLLPAPPAREVPGALPDPSFIPAVPPISPPASPRTALSPALTMGRDASTFNVSNTLAQMRAGARVNVTFWALNRGARAWEVGGGRQTVRLVTRWIKFDSGNRNGWTYQLMKTPVAPGARTRWSFDLVAPSQPGRYKLIYALQRVAPGWTPPAYNAAQESWPDDFAAIAFAVTVKP